MTDKTKNILLISLATVLSSVGLYFILYKSRFLRKPNRNIPYDNSKFVSPAMGKIVAIRKFDTESIVEDKYDDEDNISGAINVFCKDIATNGTIISIHLNLTDVHYQRCPIESKVLSVEYFLGNFKNAISKKEDAKIRYENEHCATTFETKDSIKYKVIQIAGFVARRIYTYVDKGELVAQGQEIGVIKMGSQVTIVLPSEVSVIAKVGDKVIDGETVLGILN